MYELSWLLSRGYAETSSLKIVGDRHSLLDRQRRAVMRCACGDDALEGRSSRRIHPAQMAGRVLWIDGYNVLTSLEAALAGGLLLGARDGCWRDLASMHGTYRKVEETAPALEMMGRWLSRYQIDYVRWLLDRPVSNSGRLRGIMLEVAQSHAWPWEVDLEFNPDRVLVEASQVVATADSMVLDRAAHWLNLARHVIEECVSEYWLMDLSNCQPQP